MILSIILIWVMACAVCMAWFGAACRRSEPHQAEIREDSGSSSFWILVFAVSFAALWMLRWLVGQ
jgi:hypothetical protein